jgi:hypothetical protein
VRQSWNAILLMVAAVSVSTCATQSSGPNRFGAPAPRGFFEKLADELTERECNVVRFTCPYGFGPAGEPCDCTDPRGVVVRGKTVK